MKTTRRILSMLLCLALVLGVIPVFASAAEETATISFASTAQRESQTTTKQVWKNGGVTFTNNKGSSSSNVANYSNPVRLYANSEIVVDHAGMTQIVFDCNSSSYATALKNSIGTVSGATVTVSSDKVTVKFTSAVDTFKVAKLTAQVRIDSLTVTYTAGNEGGEPECECTNTSVDHKDGKHIEICDDCGEPVTTSHTVSVEKSAAGHWEVCSCGKYDMSATPTAHDYTVKYDDDNHWNVCGCGYTTDPVEHTLVDDKCDCGYEIIPTNNYEKITTADQLVSGEYVMILQVGDKLYAPTVFDDDTDWVLVESPTVNGDVCTAPASFVWTLTVNGSSVTLTDSNGVSIAPKGFETSGITSGDHSWTLAFADGAFTFSGTDDNVILAGNKGSDCRIRAYKASTVTGNPNGYPHTFTLYKLVEETPEVPAFDSAAPVLKNDLAMNFYVPKAMFENTGYTNPYAVFNFDGNDYTVSTSTEATVNEVAMLVFTFKNIAPHKADTTITYTLKSTYNGEEVSSESGTYSVLEYCTKKLKAQDSSEKLKTLVSDLLNYCAAVQTSLGKTPLDTSAIEGFAPTTAEVTLTSCKAVTENNIENPAAAWDTATLILKDKVIVRFYFAAESIDGLSVKIAGAKNASITEIKQEGDLYYVDFTGLLATDMRKQITATVYSGDTAVSKTVTYSIESYAASYQNVAANGMGALVKAMMKYGDSAENYQ